MWLFAPLIPLYANAVYGLIWPYVVYEFTKNATEDMRKTKYKIHCVGLIEDTQEAVYKIERVKWFGFKTEHIRTIKATSMGEAWQVVLRNLYVRTNIEYYIVNSEGEVIDSVQPIHAMINMVEDYQGEPFISCAEE